MFDAMKLKIIRGRTQRARMAIDCRNNEFNDISQKRKPKSNLFATVESLLIDTILHEPFIHLSQTTESSSSMKFMRFMKFMKFIEVILTMYLLGLPMLAG